MVTCQQCNTPNQDGAAFCDNCGAQLPQPGVAPAAYPGASMAGASMAGASMAGASMAGAGIAPTVIQPVAGAPAAQPVGAASVCAQCGTPLPVGAAFCDSCGAPVAADGGLPPAQQYQPPAQQYQPPAQQYQPPAQQYQPPAQAGFYGAPPRLILQANGTPIPLPPGKAEYIIGREDPVSNTFPDVDMTLYGGDEGGVSRRHARLYQQGGQWFIEDFGSTNFTFVNNQKVLPGIPTPLSNSVELRLGKVKLTFFAQ